MKNVLRRLTMTAAFALAVIVNPTSSFSNAPVDAPLNDWNAIANPGFENGLAGWNASVSSHLTHYTKASGDDSYIGWGKASAKWEPTAASETLTSALIQNYPISDDRGCIAYIYFRGDGRKIYMGTVNSEGAPQGSTVWLTNSSDDYIQSAYLYTPCRTSTGEKLALQLKTSASPSAIYIDRVYLGPVQDYTPGSYGGLLQKEGMKGGTDEAAEGFVGELKCTYNTSQKDTYSASAAEEYVDMFSLTLPSGSGQWLMWYNVAASANNASGGTADVYGTFGVFSEFGSSPQTGSSAAFGSKDIGASKTVYSSVSRMFTCFDCGGTYVLKAASSQAKETGIVGISSQYAHMGIVDNINSLCALRIH